MKKETILLKEDINFEIPEYLKEAEVWLSLKELSDFFQKDQKSTERYISSALKEELENSSVCSFATIQKEGSYEVIKEVEHYNLDAVISIAYRCNSLKGIQFRKWANSILREYIKNGAVIDQKRIETADETVRLESELLESIMEF